MCTVTTEYIGSGTGKLVRVQLHLNILDHIQVYKCVCVCVQLHLIIFD